MWQKQERGIAWHSCDFECPWWLWVNMSKTPKKSNNPPSQSNETWRKSLLVVLGVSCCCRSSLFWLYPGKCSKALLHCCTHGWIVDGEKMAQGNGSWKHLEIHHGSSWYISQFVPMDFTITPLSVWSFWLAALRLFVCSTSLSSSRSWKPLLPLGPAPCGLDYLVALGRCDSSAMSTLHWK